MLTSKRINFYINDTNAVTPLLKYGRRKLHGKIHHTGMMLEVALCMYVHKNLTSLVPKLAEAIREIKTIGLIEHYRKIAFHINDD